MNNKRVDETLVTDPERRHDIQRRINSWLRVSLGEWRVDKTRSPHDLTVTEKNNRDYQCAFCHANLTATAYYVDNRINGVSIVLGSDCVKRLSNPEFMGNSHIAKTSEQLVRYEHLVAKYPEVEIIMRAGRNRVEEVNFVVSHRLIVDFGKAYKKVNASVSVYKRTGSFTGKAKELSQNISKYSNTWSRIERFQDKAEKNSVAYLDQDIILNEKRLDKGNAEEVIRSVQKNQGKINTEVASKIRNFPFLEKVASVYRDDTALKLMNISAVDNGTMHLILNLRAKKYGFYSPSNLLVRYIGFPLVEQKTLEVADIVKHLNDVLEPDSQANGELIKDAVRFIESKGIHELFITSNKVWKKPTTQQNDWLSERYKARHFFVDEDGNVTELKRENLIDLAKNIVLGLQEDRNISRTLENMLVGNLTEKALYQSIQTSFDITRTFN